MAIPAKPSLQTSLRVAVLAYEGCSAWIASAAREAFDIAALLHAAKGQGSASIEVFWLGTTDESVTASAGVTINVTRLSRGAFPDVLIVPPVWHSSVEDFRERVAALTPEVALISRMSAKGTTVASICSGSALLAAAGLLDGRAATGCWWLEPALRRLYPKVKWEFRNSLIRDGAVMTAGAGSAYSALVFELLTQAGRRALATEVSRLLGIEPNREAQSDLVRLGPALHEEDPLVAHFQHYVWNHLDKPNLDIDTAARRLSTSARTLFRRVRAATGHSPLRVIQLARLERAKALLADTRLSVEAICERCGWRDTSSFRKLFSREVGLTVGAWRKAFVEREPAELVGTERTQPGHPHRQGTGGNARHKYGERAT